MLRLLLAASLAVLWVVPCAFADPPRWAPADRATIRPGVSMHTTIDQCTASFVFYDAERVYLSYAAHCAPGEVQTCASGSAPLGTPVEIEGATRPGVLVYSGWLASQAAGESNGNRCLSNDFALVAIDPADAARVNPTLPVFGGPTGLRTTQIQPGERVLSFGNSQFRGGVSALKPREGEVVSSEAFSHSALYVTPSIFGDSGSAELDGAGGAVGVFSTLGGGTPGAATATDLAQALAFMRAHVSIAARLALGTEPFVGPQVLGAGRVASPASDPDPQPEPVQTTGAVPPPAAAPAPAAPAAPSASKPKTKRTPSCRRHRSRAARKRCERRRRQAARRTSSRGRTSATRTSGTNHAR